jgi:uroporphyrinogen decarboxylase
MHAGNDLILRAARGEDTPRTPVWLMRQAGRILREYRDVRARAGSFINLVKNPELVTEVTLQPVDLLGVDAAIIFSDILVVPEAMGFPYDMQESRGPVFNNTFRRREDLSRILSVEPERDLHYVLQSIRMVKRELQGRVPLIGFAGAPWTIFCYLTEGKGSKEFSVARRMAREDPELAHQLLSAISEATLRYLKAQIEAGADMVQIFDSWAGVLGPEEYRLFSLPYLEKICQGLQDSGVPVTLFAKGAHYAVGDLAALPARTIGLDWTMSIEEARGRAGTKSLQGNMDPACLYSEENAIIEETHKMLRRFGPRRYIANLGHGVYPDTDPGKVRLFVETVKGYVHETV